MTAEKGRGFLVKLGDGANPEIFSTIGGMRSTSLNINSTPVDITHKDSGGWRSLLSGAGVRRLSVSGSGIFTNSAAETALRAQALAGSIANFQILFENGDLFSGPFQVTTLDYSGEHDGARTYTMSLESAGVIDLSVAP
ncbi:tail protein [Iodidimonas muriae]|uniref:Tail protein n=1 Tax=Iodidimonas muriae TaxID=261467 RepID=A0ABQ2LDS9_9PROT|nr:phage major tail protein, TP901-1 family [Iodidimonas muriae]GER08229.1 tail protein [Kordiimonadales bacterium JCM 17843]GGO12500.1 tail protein [Iodidimonas muriae]